MTSLTGMRVIDANSRLFLPLSTFQIIVDAIAVALVAIIAGRLDADTPISQAACNQFPLVVRFPFLAPMLSVADQTPLKEIAFHFCPIASLQPLPAGKVQTNIPDFGNTIITAITPIYVNFYEKHQGWIASQCGQPTKDWPQIFRFAWAIRNAISHRTGHLHFDGRMGTPPVIWHHLTYSPADEGRLVVGGKGDLGLGDMIVLMFELSDELDRLGCPLDP